MAITPSFVSVSLLAIIVLIRPILSLSLELEIEGRSPWPPRDTRPGRGVQPPGSPSGLGAVNSLGVRDLVQAPRMGRVQAAGGRQFERKDLAQNHGDYRGVVLGEWYA